jgi:hypothetical protein
VRYLEHLLYKYSDRQYTIVLRFGLSRSSEQFSFR